MADTFFSLNRSDQRDALEFARAESGRAVHLLEKDIWVVWTLQTLFQSPLAGDLTFKGGTSLSKAWKIIDRFSEDIDLTYDIRKLIPDLTGADNDLPASRSQANKWTQAVRQRLPDWIAAHVQPVLQAGLERDGLSARLEIDGKDRDKLLLHYPALSHGTGYVAPVVTLEFGARSTGEPHQLIPVTCDMATVLPVISFPEASPLVMSISRTFWEKATAAHVFCAQGRIRGERYARHWHDLAAIACSQYIDEIIADESVASNVARHKSSFFIEKDRDGNIIDYQSATTGQLLIVPSGKAWDALAEDYAAMQEDEILITNALPFEQLMDACTDLQTRINRHRHQP
ncbi:MAG: nucleotidyl transferase AbiEii/AbiGii toxin family protein [Lautropia sp.]|nr:nucleotidyl transferase AbiEii/AbiGii toxin family protein [Lautropia sp.]